MGERAAVLLPCAADRGSPEAVRRACAAVHGVCGVFHRPRAEGTPRVRFRPPLVRGVPEGVRFWSPLERQAAPAAPGGTGRGSKETRLAPGRTPGAPRVPPAARLVRNRTRNRWETHRDVHFRSPPRRERSGGLQVAVSSRRELPSLTAPGASGRSSPASSRSRTRVSQSGGERGVASPSPRWRPRLRRPPAARNSRWRSASGTAPVPGRFLPRRHMRAAPACRRMRRRSGRCSCT